MFGIEYVGGSLCGKEWQPEGLPLCAPDAIFSPIGEEYWMVNWFGRPMFVLATVVEEIYGQAES